MRSFSAAKIAGSVYQLDGRARPASIESRKDVASIMSHPSQPTSCPTAMPFGVFDRSVTSEVPRVNKRAVLGPARDRSCQHHVDGGQRVGLQLDARRAGDVAELLAPGRAND